MRHLLTEGKFVDVEITVEGDLIKAHRLVLCASSQVFEVMQHLITMILYSFVVYTFSISQDLFSQQKGTLEGHEIDLEGVRAVDMKALLQVN